ncbi:MAG TPA: sigma-54 dependent transcriptional regulator [Candidatus Binatia bacterium]
MLNPILIIGGSKRYVPLFSALKDLGIETEQIPSASDALTTLETKSYGAVLMEWDFSQTDSLETVEKIRKSMPHLPVVALGSGPEIHDDKAARSKELMDYLPMTGVENVDLARLLTSLKQAVPELREQVLPGRDLLCMKTNNEKMKKILALVDIIKDESGSVLIQGENGTGKEVIAWLLHYSGRIHANPFVAINCAAIPETLLESELFGHEKGSFTGATEKRIGKFELAHKGTAFLDEIGDMPINTQAKILRVLETGVIERVGGHKKIPVKLRIVAATNHKILDKIDKGEFRQDLYYRINTFTLHLPPLRERKEDLLALAQHFLDLVGARRGGGPRKRISREAEQILLAYDWPGNVRELRNVMERAAVLTANTQVGPEALPDELLQRPRQGPCVLPQQPFESVMVPTHSNGDSSSPSPIIPLKELERKAIIDALSQVGYNATQTAKQLGISKATLYRKLKEYRISRRLILWS